MMRRPTRSRARRRVSIVGKGPTQHYPGTGDVWGLNSWPIARPFPRSVTAWFQIHPRGGRSQGEEAWARACPVPLYMLPASCAHRYPLSRPYPFEEIAPGPLASSFDYMLALAIARRFARIDVYGVDLQRGTPRERLCEHVSFAYWVGMARGRGIVVKVHGEGALHFPYRYGFHYHRERTWGQRMALWGAMAFMNFKGFDDGDARDRVRGWEVAWSPRKVMVSI